MTHYSSKALETFADVLVALVGRVASIKIGGTQAYTDGTTIVLPSQGVWSACDFAALCGVACHEVAHVWFRSNQQLQTLVAIVPPSDADLVKAVFNIVIDVADEARFEEAMPNAAPLFAAIYLLIAPDILADLKTANPNCTKGVVLPMRLLLCAALHWQRWKKPYWSGGHSKIRSQIYRLCRHAEGFRKVVAILRRTEAAARRGFRPANPANRTPKQWAAIGKRVQELTDLLKLLYGNQASFPAQSGSGQNHAGNDRTNQKGNGSSQNGSPNVGQATTGSSANANPWQAYFQRAVKGNGNSGNTGGVSGPATSVSDDWSSVAVIPAQPSKSHSSSPGKGVAKSPARRRSRKGFTFRQDVYQEVLPSFRRSAMMLATQPTRHREDGFASGNRLGKLYRASIDGRCFARACWEEAEGSAIAIVVDHSDSMETIAEIFIPVAAALAESLAAVPDVNLSVWRYGSIVQKLNRPLDLAQYRSLGGTATDAAVRSAGKWLDATGLTRKTLILFTDGQPNSIPATNHEVIEFRRTGGRILVGSIGYCMQDCALSIPGAYIFDVNPQTAAASLQTTVRRLMRS